MYFLFVSFYFLLFTFDIGFAFTVSGMSIPQSSYVSSGTDRHVSAWVPYWRGESGTAEAQRTMLYVDTFSPFIYEVDSKGTIKNRSNLTDKNWSTLIAEARSKAKQIIPTILWLKGTEQRDILNNPKTRAAHVREVVSILKNNPHFHGIDIDYEGRKSAAQKGFSSFIVELKREVRALDKVLVCTLETRNPNTPYGSIPLEDRANDFKLLGKECDIVRFMTYDQRNADEVLTKRYDALGTLYMPIADKEWVEKVLVETLKDIPKEKLELGIPTYGHVYKIRKRQKSSGWEYERMRSLTYTQFIERSQKYGRAPERNIAGESSFTYTIDSGEQKGEYLAWFSDAVAVAQKVRIAERYGIRGVAIFSLNGANDPQLPLEL